MVLHALVLSVAAGPSAPPAPAPQIVVRDLSWSCYGSTERVDEWVVMGGAVWCLGRELPLERVEELRALALAAPEEVDDVLATLGVTPEALAAHRGEVFAAVLSPWWKPDERAPAMPESVEPLLAWDRLEEAMRRHALSEDRISTANNRIEISLPGDPSVTLLAQGLERSMLPWKVTVGERTWTSPDVRLSRAVLAFVAPDGPSYELLDGDRYWRECVWRDEIFWTAVLDLSVDEAFAKTRYAALKGWGEACTRFRVDEIGSGWNLGRPCLVLGLSTWAPGPIEEVTWANPLEDGEPTASWRELLATWRAARRAVERETWIASWRRAGWGRRVALQALGPDSIDQPRADVLATLPWRVAGLHGAPDFELELQRRGEVCATVYIARDVPGALVTKARPVPGHSAHWLDALEVALDSFDDAPDTYAVVDASGRVEVRSSE